MTEPRNVTPGFESPRSSDSSFVPPTPKQSGFEPPEWVGWSWTTRGRSFPWLGILLVVVGAGLLIEYFVPAITAGTLILGGVSAAFLAGWLLGGSYFAAVPGLLLAALVVARLVVELNIYTGPGTTGIAVAAAFLLIWFIGRSRGRGAMWPLWGAAIFGLVGFVQLSGRLGGVPELGPLWPIVIIVIGLIVVLGGRRRGSPPRVR